MSSAFAHVEVSFNRFLVCEKCGYRRSIKDFFGRESGRLEDLMFVSQCGHCGEETRNTVDDVPKTEDLLEPEALHYSVELGLLPAPFTMASLALAVEANPHYTRVMLEYLVKDLPIDFSASPLMWMADLLHTKLRFWAKANGGNGPKIETIVAAGGYELESTSFDPESLAVAPGTIQVLGPDLMPISEKLHYTKEQAEQELEEWIKYQHEGTGIYNSMVHGGIWASELASYCRIHQLKKE